MDHRWQLQQPITEYDYIMTASFCLYLLEKSVFVV